MSFISNCSRRKQIAYIQPGEKNTNYNTYILRNLAQEEGDKRIYRAVTEKMTSISTRTAPYHLKQATKFTFPIASVVSGLSIFANGLYNSYNSRHLTSWDSIFCTDLAWKLPTDTIPFTQNPLNPIAKVFAKVSTGVTCYFTRPDWFRGSVIFSEGMNFPISMYSLGFLVLGFSGLCFYHFYNGSKAKQEPEMEDAVSQYLEALNSVLRNQEIIAQHSRQSVTQEQYNVAQQIVNNIQLLKDDFKNIDFIKDREGIDATIDNIQSACNAILAKPVRQLPPPPKIKMTRCTKACNVAERLISPIASLSAWVGNTTLSCTKSVLGMLVNPSSLLYRKVRSENRHNVPPQQTSSDEVPQRKVPTVPNSEVPVKEPSESKSESSSVNRSENISTLIPPDEKKS